MIPYFCLQELTRGLPFELKLLCTSSSIYTSGILLPLLLLPCVVHRTHSPVCRGIQVNSADYRRRSRCRHVDSLSVYHLKLRTLSVGHLSPSFFLRESFDSCEKADTRVGCRGLWRKSEKTSAFPNLWLRRRYYCTVVAACPVHYLIPVGPLTHMMHFVCCVGVFNIFMH